MRQTIDGQYIKTHVFRKFTLKEKIQDKLRRDRDVRLVRTLKK